MSTLGSKAEEMFIELYYEVIEKCEFDCIKTCGENDEKCLVECVNKCLDYFGFASEK